MYDVTALGELLIDFTYAGKSEAGMSLFEQNPGGAIVRTNEGLSRAAAAKCAVVDTTGAGDAFWGGFLFKLLESGKRPDELTLDEARDCAVFANACAALCVQNRGAIPAMPEREETIRLYQKIR